MACLAGTGVPGDVLVSLSFHSLPLKVLTKNLLRHKDLNAAITQLVEWLAVNQHVTGSSPVGGAFWACSSVRLERPAHNRAVMRSNRIRPTRTFFLISPGTARSGLVFFAWHCGRRSAIKTKCTCLTPPGITVPYTASLSSVNPPFIAKIPGRPVGGH